jgi:pimeloyl-ACP methyl ester carboxylesterase
MPHVATPDGTRIWHTDEGPSDGGGLPLLALPGLTRNGGDFDHLAPHLAKVPGGVRLIRVDLRGRGRSDHADPSTYTVPREAQDVLAVMDALGLARAAILGTSRGGLVAMLLAATKPDRVLGVGLNDVGPAIEPAGLRAIEGYLGRAPAQATHEEAARARARLSPAFRGVPHERWLHEARNHYEEASDGLRLRYDKRLREPFLAAMAAPLPDDPWPLFDALQGLPLLLLRGAHSDILSRATAQEMRRRRPDMTFAEVPDRGHVPFLDEPEALGAIQAWLDRCRAQA